MKLTMSSKLFPLNNAKFYLLGFWQPRDLSKGLKPLEFYFFLRIEFKIENVLIFFE